MAPRPDLHPSNADSADLMRRLQAQVVEAASFEGASAIDVNTDIIGAVDQAFPHSESIISAAIASHSGSVIERTHHRQTPSISYIPGLLAFREGPAAIEAVSDLDAAATVVLVDGNGRIHPRQAGLATHLGVVLDLPTIGVAKSLLCGTPSEPIDELEAGESVAITAGEDVNADPDTIIGHAVQTKQYAGENRHINPLIVSPGHRIGAMEAVDIVLETADRHKLPEPLHEVDRYVSELARDDGPKR